MPEFEYRYGPLEFREKEGGMGAVAGTVMRYGDVATLPFGQERMLPGARLATCRRPSFTRTGCISGTSPLPTPMPGCGLMTTLTGWPAK